jgi:pimeloyl-ACP methyl ester carboxylesterase
MMSTLISGDVKVNGIKIHYYQTDSNKPPVVLAHGITDNGLCWNLLAEVLAQSYQVIMFDARGHGLSEPNPPDFTIQSHAADLAGLIDALDLDQPVIIGHSMGAANTAWAAATYPDLARGIILEDPPWLQDTQAQERVSVIEEWRSGIVERQTETIEAIVAAGRDDHPGWKVDWDAWAEAKLQVNPDVVEWIRSELPFIQWREMVPKIICPTLLITGDPELEALVTPETAQEVSALSDRVEIARIGRAGHNIRRENFEEYVSVVGKFLRRVF